MIIIFADWNATDYVKYADLPFQSCDLKLALPLVLHLLTPPAVALIGLGAVSAAVMSSCDSAWLAPGSLFAQNVYRPIRNILTEKHSWKKVRGFFKFFLNICVQLFQDTGISF